MAYDTPYHVETVRENYSSFHRIIGAGDGCIAWTTDVVLAHKIIDALNRDARRERSTNTDIINPSEA